MKKYSLTYTHIKDFLQHVLEENTQNEKSLSHFIKNSNTLKDFNFFTYAPVNLPTNMLYEFEHSNEKYYSKENYTEILDYAVKFISEYLEQHSENICLGYSCWNAEDKWINKKTSKYQLLTYKNDLYYLLKNSQKRKEDILDYILTFQSYWPNQVILLSHMQSTTLQHLHISEEQLKRIANNTSGILINTQDLKNYIFGQKTGK